jgi:hypothetical protein
MSVMQHRGPHSQHLGSQMSGQQQEILIDHNDLLMNIVVFKSQKIHDDLRKLYAKLLKRCIKFVENELSIKYMIC